MALNVIRQFEQLWETQSASPDVFALVNGQGRIEVDQLLALLTCDQERRWRTEHPLRVEDYLSGLTELSDGIDWKLELAIGEFLARQKTNQPLSDHEISSRFSDFGDTLRDRLRELTAGEPKAAGELAKSVATATRTETHIQHGVRSTVTYISSAGIGVEQKGRYRLDRILGEGAFGRVYLGFDEELQRQVAIKVPTKDRFQKPEDAEAYLAEARMVASLDHSHIVPVYDVGRTLDGSIYVVSKFIAGSTLEGSIKAGPLPQRDAATLLATIAAALQHAHQRRLIHRDIKPANILIEENTNTPYVADFGLAVREEDYLKHSAIAGTPAYMSPEQARGEGHRLDGRSDIFSLGVMLYEILTGKKPFRGSSTMETLNHVISLEPKPPRELVEAISPELERICMKALSKRASDRYGTATELADDLQQWLQPAATPTQPKAEVQVIPKGLRSFDAHDADFFLDLLPGTRNREGLPESIAFWKKQIEQTDAEQTFSVGLIYGPSGCGKSSLVKAGLLPHLAPDIVAVYVEATPDETETRILRGLRKQLVDLPDDMGLTDTLAALRRGQGHKVVIMLDQFEQWLHAHRADADAELVNALRQCDGGHLQAIVMVRDDFSMAASRFMRALDTRILEGHNFATVDLFDIDHAAKVLTKFGQAFGKLPANAGNLSADEQQFISQVAKGMAQEGKVVSVRLSLFSDMVKNKAWKPVTLEQVGGTQGIGVNFLEETFSSREANPDHRLHAVAARGVLRALLPELGTDIKGHMRSQAELLEASGYQDQSASFADLLRILDGELRLITPTDPEGHESQSKSDSNTQYYQLTHDYLVPSLREWLTRKQKETRRGRAELKLAERTALWNSKSENRHLPSLFEWISIRSLTDAKQWTQSQRALMHKSTGVHGMRVGLATALFVMIVAAGLSINKIVAGRQQALLAQKNEEQSRAEATRLVEGLLQAETAGVDVTIGNLTGYRIWADPLLKQAFADAPEGSNAKLHASLGLLPVDPSQVDYLKRRLLEALPAQVPVIVKSLAPHKIELVDDLWEIIEQASPEHESQILHAAAALAAFEPDSTRWHRLDTSDRIVRKFVSENPLRASVWIGNLMPVRQHLSVDLESVFGNRDGKFTDTQRDLATAILEQYTADNLTSVTELIMTAEPKHFVTLYDEFAAFGGEAADRLNAELDRKASFHWNDEPLEKEWLAVRSEIVQQFTSADGQIAERFAFCQTMPLDEFLEVAELLRPSGYRPTRVRPYAHQNSVLVAAVWTRDSRAWELATGLSADEILQHDEQNRAKGWLACDIAGYVFSASDQYVGVWSKKTSEQDDAKIFVGKTHNELEAVVEAIPISVSALHSLQAFQCAKGTLSYSGIKVKTTDGDYAWWFGLSPAGFAQKAYLDRILWDLNLSPAASVESTQGRQEEILAAVWQPSAKYEAHALLSDTPAKQLASSKTLIEEGFRPVACSAASIGAAQELVVASVWHRPLIEDYEKENLAKRQANAAAAAIRLGKPERVWPLFRHSPDPRLRTWVIDRLASLGITATTIANQLQREPDNSSRRALIIALGEYQVGDLEEQEDLIELLLTTYRNDPDPGIHAAAEWVLKKHGFQAELNTIDEELATSKLEGNRQWYVTKTNKHTLTLVPASTEFSMGSPATEQDRGQNESLSLGKIDRSFLIATKEVTLEQYWRFANQVGTYSIGIDKYCPEVACPHGTVWYEAAWYCNWLSECEGISSDQWCYEPNEQGKFDAGMKIKSGFLDLTGYRLPIQSEWEFAARAGAITSRHYGQADSLLTQYAWYLENAQNHTWPVGSLKPNDFGLFDMLGSVAEWCSEKANEDPAFNITAWKAMPNGGIVDNGITRVVRGEGFDSHKSLVRSANKRWDRPPNFRHYNIGFRPVRTFILSP